MTIKKLLCLVAYYDFARFLPASTSPLTHGIEAFGVSCVILYIDQCGSSAVQLADSIEQRARLAAA